MIPKAIRDRLGLQPGDRLVVGEQAQEVRIRKLECDPDHRRSVLVGLRGALADRPSLRDALERDRRAERERDERREAERNAARRS